MSFFDARFALQSLEAGAGLVMAITAAETRLHFQPYARTGILTWELGRRTPPVSHRPLLRGIGDFFYEERRFKALISLRLGLGLAMVACALLAWFPPLLIAAALVSSLLVLFRAEAGQEASFQLRIIMLTVLFTCSISPWDSAAFRVGLYFLSAQVVLSYFLAGVAKLRGPAWRDGTGLVGIFGTVYHGVGWMHHLLSGHPSLARGTSWFIIVFELLFPLVLLGDERIVMGFLVLTTLFHLATSVLMGLNGFLFSFVATYPTLIYCVGRL